MELKDKPKFEGTTLFNFAFSSSAWRVRLALAFKEIEYKSIFVNLTNGEQKSESYKKINPTGCVPALFIDGNILTDSTAIIEYLEETRETGVPLLPKCPVKRA
jgi:glutathione S-transferase